MTFRQPPIGCPECGAAGGLHALSCSRYPKAGEPAVWLTDAELAVLRALVPYEWQAWPPDEYDQGLPVIELRQADLRSLLDELEEWRRGGKGVRRDSQPGQGLT